MMPVTDQQRAALNQTYRECLKARFNRNYYQFLYNRTIRYAKSFDYLIGLGSAASGGTGLGILATPSFAWVCGPITTISVLLSVAKGVWDWAGKAKFSLDRMQFYDKLSTDYQSLVDDVDAAQQWTADFAQRRDALRENSNPGTPDPYPELSEKLRRTIQSQVKTQISYKQWWEWRDAA